eukprot:CAMPEP_0119299842 /NCGR_PEP_ID=MMETSP1333-20130426/1874_1 /TAXON_ID=418940 /ORGANISM="Scyphosphaera apsteinii, Strain RCC1455" /LENGTH=41 /DNA_ID= /DNA_START= /DNA_END= /DNA_ORIENTATION=
MAESRTPDAEDLSLCWLRPTMPRKCCSYSSKRGECSRDTKA